MTETAVLLGRTHPLVSIIVTPRQLDPSRPALILLNAGIVHHVAFRTGDDPQQQTWRTQIAGAGLNVSQVMDRKYFHSIYYREPGGVLFELATDGPGFARDEAAGALGTTLILPPWLEPQHDAITRALPPLNAARTSP